MTRYKKEDLILYLKENYSKKSKKEILNDLGLSWNYIQKMCHLFSIKREFNECDRKYTLSKLLEYDNTSCYWLGFLLADGHISKQINLQVNLSNKDLQHFLKFGDHIGTELIYYPNEELNSVGFALSDKPTLLQIRKTFNWSSNKTKNIPTIPEFLSDDQLFSLVIGFIDGDGSIEPNNRGIHIKCDKNWKSILEDFYYILTNEYKTFELSSDSCSIIYINKGRIQKKIKNRALSLELPLMKRKWDRIIDNIVDNCLFCGETLKNSSVQLFCNDKCKYQYHKLNNFTTIKHRIKKKDLQRENDIKIRM